jgi:hypothetical protein
MGRNHTVGGNQSQNWLMMKNGDHAIELFQGMIDMETRFW